MANDKLYVFIIFSLLAKPKANNQVFSHPCSIVILVWNFQGVLFLKGKIRKKKYI